MIENLWILKYKVMVMLNICNLIKLKPISKNPQRFTTRVSQKLHMTVSFVIFYLKSIKNCKISCVFSQ